ncbi:MAG: hypothetical protein J6F30_00580 [Cellulosilyticum sp.]|nr:hypothetical protein [Cellulosilyticum sp.]
MGNGCNNIQNILGTSCGYNNANNSIVIIAAIIALILINILADDTADCIGELLQAIGELMSLSITKGCFNHLGNNSCCNYY